MKRIFLTSVGLLWGIVGAGPLAAGTLLATVTEQTDRQPLPDAVVTARPLDFTPPAPAHRLVLVDQIDKEFVSKTTLIQVGDSINFPNKDNIDHHVYSFSAPKQFELPLYKDMPDHPILFDKPGVVKLGCNIHDWMVGYIYVSDTPYAALTDAQGKATLADLPDGEYEVRLWHARLDVPERQTTRRVRIEQGRPAIRVDWAVGLTPDFRPRRAPLGFGRDY